MTLLARARLVQRLGHLTILVAAAVSEGSSASAQDKPDAAAAKPQAAASAADKRPEFDIVGKYLDARCASALCFDVVDTTEDSRWLGIEPLVELPVGKSFGLGNGSLAHYVNNHDIKVQLAAGLRVWLFRDLLSLSLYLSIPLSSTGVRLEGSTFTYPATSIRRPYPGFSIGLLYDVLWIGIDHDELRNGDSVDSNAYNPEFPANVSVSSCTTITVALQLVTAARALFGALRD